MKALFVRIIDYQPAILLLPIALAGIYFWSPTWRMLIHWLLKFFIAEPSKYCARWAFFALRKTTKAMVSLATHLSHRRTYFHPELGSPGEPGTVPTRKKPLQIAGAADTWSILLMTLGALLHFTSAWQFIYPDTWQSNSTMLWALSVLESLAISWGVIWVIWRVWNTLPQRNALRSKLRIRSSDALNNSAEFRIGRRVDTGQPVYLPANLLYYNLLGYGAPGSGKTTFAKLLMYQQIKRGGGMLFIDAKLDSDDVKQICSFAKSVGRENDILFINPGNPDESNTYNPILVGDEDEISARCLALIPEAESAGEDHYRESARRAIKTTIAALRALGLRFNFRDLSTILGSDRAMSAFHDELLTKVPDHSATADFMFLLEQYKLPSGQFDVRRLQETYGGISGRLATFGTGKFGEVTSSYSPEVNLFDAVRENKIVYVSLPTMGKSEAATNFAKMLVADLRTALSWLQALPGSERKLFLAFLDEAATYSMPAMQSMFSQNRSARLSLIPLTQTRSQFVGEVSEEFANIIETDCKTKVFFQLGDAASCKSAAELIGEKTGVSNTATVARSHGANTNKSSASPDGSDAGGSATTLGQREERTWRVPPEDFARLSTGEAVLWTNGQDLVHFVVDLPPETPDDFQINVQHSPLPPMDGVRFYERFVLKETDGANESPVSRQGRVKKSRGASLDLYRES